MKYKSSVQYNDHNLIVDKKDVSNVISSTY